MSVCCEYEGPFLVVSRGTEIDRIEKSEDAMVMAQELCDEHQQRFDVVDGFNRVIMKAVPIVETL